MALPALGGLFALGQCPQLDAASLDNAHLLSAMQNLRWASHAVGKSGNVLAPVDYRNMGPEELGSVYESLLELVPEIDLAARKFGFVGVTSEGSTAGNARKLTGSYYTPDSLVQELIKSALDPVIQQRITAQPENPTEALLAIRVIDPACGSGHFLLAAARRLAETLARLRATEGEQTEQDFRHALREVVSRCIFGVDRNPMAVELARTALWLESFEEGRPLGFLDHHLLVGDALLGLTDLKVLELGIAKDAFKPLSGDDKEVCKQLVKTNTTALKQFVKDFQRQQGLLNLSDNELLQEVQALEALSENSTEEIAAKETAYRKLLEQAKTSRLAHAADVLVGTYLLPKREGDETRIPTSATLYLTLQGEPLSAEQQDALVTAQTASINARVLHWPLAFPQVFANGGFDCVLGNPPWERIKLQEEEYFATRHHDIAQAKNKAERAQRIQWLSEGMLAKHMYPQSEHSSHECEAETQLYAEFINTRRTAEAASVFAHVKGEDGGRYPLTGVGDVNTYALFAETISQITHPNGRAGFIVPTGIATDDSTKAYFGSLATSGRLASLFDFENREAIFPGVHRSYKLCLLTIGSTTKAEFAFFLTQTSQLADDRRRFTLSADDFSRINPNTLTCPVFRARYDAELIRKIYQRVPVFIREARGTQEEHNPWDIRFMAMFHMSNDSHLFYGEDGIDRLPLYEGKMVQAFDHRAASVEVNSENLIRSGQPRATTISEHQDFGYKSNPQYWIDKHLVKERLGSSWVRKWMIVFKSVTSPTNERTFIASLVPECGVAHSMMVAIPGVGKIEKIMCLYGNLNALVMDFVARTKVGGLNMSLFFVRQFPVLTPDSYTDADLAFIVPRVLELTYTSDDLTPLAHDLGYSDQPFVFTPERRAILRAELDAYYAKLYGLTRDELRYVLDPADVMGEDYPSETFRGLKKNEEREFGEYRTQRLVLEAWDKLKRGELN